MTPQWGELSCLCWGISSYNKRIFSWMFIDPITWHIKCEQYVDIQGPYKFRSHVTLSLCLSQQTCGEVWISVPACGLWSASTSHTWTKLNQENKSSPNYIKNLYYLEAVQKIWDVQYIWLFSDVPSMVTVTTMKSDDPKLSEFIRLDPKDGMYMVASFFPPLHVCNKSFRCHV